MRFEFATADRILFGPGTCSEVPAIARRFGRRALVVSDSAERVAPLLEGLLEQGVSAVPFQVGKEPDVDLVTLAVRKARDGKCDLVVGFGGGSALDTAKAAAALTANPGDPLDYLEVVGAGHALEIPSMPTIAIPTTAGTGSEVTRNAVIAATDHKVKVSLRSPFMLPTVAVVDPVLALSLPPALTASTGLDALTQLIEPFTCNASNPMTDALCIDGMARISRSLKQACEDAKDLAAREDMALASLFGGIALANARLGAVHGLAGSIGGMFPAPHGAVCARLLPFTMLANVNALRKRAPESPVLDRYEQIARILTGDPQAGAEAGIAWARRLIAGIGIPPLSDYGMTQEDFPAILAQAAKASSMRGNPIQLNPSELTDVLLAAHAS